MSLTDLSGLVRERLMGRAAYEAACAADARAAEEAAEEGGVPTFLPPAPPAWTDLPPQRQHHYTAAARAVADQLAYAVQLVAGSAMYCSICVRMINTPNANMACTVEWKSTAGAWSREALYRTDQIGYLMRRPDFASIERFMGPFNDPIGYYADTIIGTEPRCWAHVHDEWRGR